MLPNETGLRCSLLPLSSEDRRLGVRGHLGEAAAQAACGAPSGIARIEETGATKDPAEAWQVRRESGKG